jgi:hypothetical protein
MLSPVLVLADRQARLPGSEVEVRAEGFLGLLSMIRPAQNASKDVMYDVHTIQARAQLSTFNFQLSTAGERVRA